MSGCDFFGKPIVERLQDRDLFFFRREHELIGYAHAVDELDRHNRNRRQCRAAVFFLCVFRNDIDFGIHVEDEFLVSDEAYRRHAGKLR